jgi:hypothetical protein
VEGYEVLCEAKARLRYPMKTKTGSQVDQPPNGSLSNRGKLKDEREETLLLDICMGRLSTDFGAHIKYHSTVFFKLRGLIQLSKL